MKKFFTLALAFISMFGALQTVSALTFSVTVPAGTKACYMAGEMNGWSPSATALTKVDDTHFSIDLPNATTTQKYQYLSGPDWKYIEKTAAGEAIVDRTWAESDVVASWAEIFVFDERDVTIEALVPLEVKELYLVGSFNGWSSPSAATKMTFVSQGIDGKIYSITIHSLDAKNMEFKFVAGPAWSYEQLDPTANYKYESAENTVSVVVNSFKGYFDPEKTGTIVITATVPAGTAQAFIQGDFLGWDMAKALEGVKNQDGTFTFSIPMVMSIIYNVYNKADWSFVEADATGVKFPDRKAAFPADANTAITVVAWKQNINAVSRLEEAKNLIYSSNATLVVENVNSNVAIYDITGRLVESGILKGTFISKTLKSGVYIVKVDGATKKATVN